MPRPPLILTALGVLGLLAFGLWLRLDAIAASLWVDEFGTFWVVEDDFATMLSRAWQFQGQSPFYYLLPWLSIHTAGESEVALRAPSLVLGVAFPASMYVCGRTLAGPRAAAWSAGLSWFAAPAIRASVEARPYALVLLCVAVAVTGFIGAVRSGSRTARLLWILGGASVAWSHYVHYPLVLGLFAAYAALPGLRRHYGVGPFLLDAAWQGGLVALCAPQVLSLLMRQGTLSWLDEWNYLAFFGPLFPLLPAIAIGLFTGHRRPEDHVQTALHWCLLICLVSQVFALEAAALAGINLLTARYFISILVPAVLLAAAALARSQAIEATVALLAFVVITGQGLVVTKRVSGTFSGIGDEGWRAAVLELSARVRDEPRPLVLYRAGFVEEDGVPLGSPTPATRAPLRSPGQPPFGAPVTPLTFRWDRPPRREYFARAIAPRIGASSRFLLLARAWTPEGVRYSDQFVRWVEESWPGQFAVARERYGDVDLVEFRRSRPE